MSHKEGEQTRQNALQILERLSNKFPGLRITQLLGNAAPALEQTCEPCGRTDRDLYYVEDSQLIQWLTDYERRAEEARGFADTAVRVLAALLLGLGLAGSTAAEAEEPPDPCTVTPYSDLCQALPTDKKGKMFIFHVNEMRCVLYVSEGGMGSGVSSPSCIPWRNGENGFRLLRIIETRDVD